MLCTSLDGTWIAMRRGREVAILPGLGTPGEDETAAPGQITLAHDDAELAMIGPPTVLCAVSRAGREVVVYQAPGLEPSPALVLDAPMRLAAATGPRVALVSESATQVLVVRAAGRALSAQPIEPATPVEFVVGLDRNQLLLGLLRKLEVWDAVSARPLLRLQLQLPPPPRRVGAAHGHVWVTRPGTDEVFVYRLSDGRPFRHHAGAPVEDVIWHASSPVLVLVTARGLLRLHCFAHSLGMLDTPRATAYAQLVAGDEQYLIGDAGGPTPWRVPIGATAAPALEPTVEPRVVAVPATLPIEPIARPAAPAPEPRWRAPLAEITTTHADGAERLLDLPRDGELAELADRLALPQPARRVLALLYGAYLAGTPALAIARIAAVTGDWTEALGRGELAALAMLHRHGGKVALRTAVTDLLDGAAPRAVRVVGVAHRPTTAAPRGPAQLARDGRSDRAIESALVEQLGRIAVIEGGAAAALLEARLRDTPAVALVAPRARPLPWPRDAGLVVVADAAPPDWVAALPLLG